MPLLVDTGVLLGAADADDADHAVTSGLLSSSTDVLLVPVLVVAETAWQLERNLGPDAEARFLESMIAGELTRVDLTDADWERWLTSSCSTVDMDWGPWTRR
ncbi:MAG: PIN domain-containing protein [Acidimicrobiia bacterium]|nr:PIN domain-containing protein [Acidimicrobiia bacterium]